MYRRPPGSTWPNTLFPDPTCFRAFIGLVVPHAMHFIVCVRQARLVPASALAGAVCLIASDIISRIIIPGQVLPIGVITALVGAPAFALILLRGKVSR